MQAIIQQVGALLLGSVPTLILFIALVVAYQFLVQGPLSRTLGERRARTTGAVEEAHKAIAAAEARTAEYAEKLRQARAEVFRMREQRLHQWSIERDAALTEARRQAGARVIEARSVLSGEVAAARQMLLASADQLALQVVGAVLPQTAGGVRS